MKNVLGLGAESLVWSCIVTQSLRRFAGLALGLMVSAVLTMDALATPYDDMKAKITVTGGTTSSADSGNAMLIKFTSTSGGSFTMPADSSATARILVVGGGGSGSSLKSTAGIAGAGGKGSDTSNLTLIPGGYTVAVGAGGTYVQTSGSSKSGNAGSASSVTGPAGFTTISAAGGTAGPTSGSAPTTGWNTASDITGSSVTYGKNGQSSATANTGNGGAGASTGKGKSIAGSSGIVVVKITNFSCKETVDLGTIQISVGDSFAVTNAAGGRILSSDVKGWYSSNEDIATIASSNGYAVVQSGVRDGLATLRMETAATNYTMKVRCLTVWIEKTIRPATEDDPEDKSNATIRVTSHVMVGVTEIPTNRILYIGSTCTSHGLGGSDKSQAEAQRRVAEQLNTLASKGDVDWYLYGNSSGAASTTTPVANGSGHIVMGHTNNTVSATMTNSKHRNMLAYLTRLDASLDDGHENYDYVVLSFDSSRLAIDYPTGNTELETRVANKLSWYYTNNRVIWITDPYQTDDKYEQYKDEFYRPSNTHDDGVMSVTLWRAYLAIVDPNLLLSWPDTTTAPYTSTKQATSPSSFTSYAATRIDNQATYDNPEKVKEMLDSKVQAAVYDSELVDTILNLDSSLDIIEVKFFTWKGSVAPETLTNEDCKVIADLSNDSTHWMAEPASAYKVDGYTVTANITNILKETWNKFEIKIVDKGTFLRKSIEAGKAKQDPVTGLWEVDPNDGPAHVALYSTEGSTKLEVGARAQTTTILWTYEDPRSGFIVESSDVSKTYDGVPTNIVIKVTEGPADPTIQYRKVGETTWLTYDPAAGFVNVADSGKVEFKVSKEGSSAAPYYGTNSVTITAVPTKPWNPANPEDPTDLTPPSDPDPTGSYHAWAGAQNIVKCYDGLGTNVVVTYGPAALDPTIRYSTNNVDFVTWDELQLTNVCAATKIYFSFAKDNYETVTNHAWVTITQRVATITFTAADKVFDNTTTATCNGTNFANVVSGEGFTLDTSAMTFNFSDAAVGSGKTVTATGYNDTLVSATGDTLKLNYAFNFVDTTTASITKAIQPGVTSNPYNGTYDGSEHTITVDPDGGTPYYWVDGAWKTTPPEYADKVTTNVIFKVVKGGYEDFIGTNTVTISAKAVTLTSASDSFVYNGASHVKHALTGVDGFVAGETFTTNWVGAITDVGTTNNEFAISFNGTAKASNYALTTNYGTLTVTPANVGDPTKPGDPAPGTGLDFGGEGKDKVPYKGTGWEPEVTVTNTFATLVPDVDYTVKYGNNTNVTDKAVVEITGKGNYTGVFTNYFEITKIPLTAKADDKSIVYGSAVPETAWYTFTYSGFTNGETKAVLTTEPTFGSAYTTTTPVGPIAIAKQTDGAAKNYTFVYVNGTLTVTKESIEIGGKGPFNNETPPPGPPAKEDDSENDSGVRNVIKTYDGVGTNIIVNVTKPTSGSEVVYSVDGGVTYLPLGSVPAFTNAVDGTQVWYVVSAPGCDPVTNYAWVTVKPADVTITSANGDFTYTGSAQSNATANAVGFVDGEGADYADFKTIVTVSESGAKNTFTYALKSNTLAGNYTITVVEGTLAMAPGTITPQPPKDPSDPSDPTPSGTDPWTGAANIVKVFDNTGTNIIAKFANIKPDGHRPNVEYSTDETNWFAWEALQFTNVCDQTQVFYRVTDANYNTLTNSAYVTITNAVIQPMGPEPFDPPTDGTPWAGATNVVKVYDGVGTNILAVGGNFLPDGVVPEFRYSTSATGPFEVRIPGQFTAVTNVEVFYTVTVPNYAVLTNSAWVTIVEAPIKPVGPSEPPVPGGIPPPVMPVPPTDGSAWAGATNIVKCFDDTGTNVVAVYGNLIPDGVIPTIRYSTNDIDFVAWEELQLTNVCHATKVSFTVTVPNYATLTNSAYVTITNAVIKKVGPGTPSDPQAPGMPPPPTDGSPWAGATNVVKVFDGAGTNILAVYGNILPLGTVPTIRYSTSANGPFGALDPEQFSNITNVEVFFTVEAPNYATLTNSAWVKITPRVVTVTAVSTNKVYATDDPTFTATVTGLVGSDTITNAFDRAPGESVGSYAITPTGAPIQGDYAVSYVPGTLTITPATPVIPEEEGPGGPFRELPPGTPPPAPTEGTLLSTNDYIGVYDGAAHTILTNRIWGAIAENPLYAGNDPQVEYSTDGTAWQPDPFTFVDVDQTPTSFWYRITADNCSNYYHAAGVTITQRVVTVTSGSQEWIFDGQSHQNTNVTVTVGSFVEGEGIETNNFASIKFVAESPKNNTFDVSWPVGTKESNYALTKAYGQLKVAFMSIGPVPVDPAHPEGPFKPAENIVIPPIDPLTYDGGPQEPMVVVTNTVIPWLPFGLELGTDYDIVYGNNTNATEEAYAVVIGKGNYGGCFTNYFTILPREVTLKSGSKTMYLDPEKPGESVTCSNGLVWIVFGSFVTNRVTMLEDGFDATVPNALESATPVGPISNDFTVVVNPGLETNYCFTLIPGELAIYSTPTNAQSEIHEEIPSPHGGVIDVVMDNNDAGKYAADKPQELNDEAMTLEKGPTDKIEFRMTLSTNCVEESYVDISNEVVAAAYVAGHAEGKTDEQIKKEIDSYVYDKFDIAVDKLHAYCDTEGVMTNLVTQDWGNNVSRLLTVKIPYTFSPKLIGFSVWRNHTNETGGVTHDGVKPLPYYGTVPATEESWETNSTEVILRVQKFSVYVFPSLFLSTPQLTGRMRWKYHQARNSFYGGLDVVCTNGDHTVISNLCYIYEDRNDCYLRNLTSAEKLSATSKVVIGGKDFGKVELDPSVLTGAGALWVTNRYGVLDSCFASVYSFVPEAQRKVALVTTSIEKLHGGDASVVNQTLGYLTWQEKGYSKVYWCALGEGLPPLPVEGDGLTMGGVILVGPPPTLAAYNDSLGYGLPSTTLDSDPSLRIAAFNVNGALANGRVETVGAGGVTGVPGPNARLEVLGSSEPDGTYATIATPALGADGSFSFQPPDGIKYFQVRLSLIPVIQ